MGGAHTIPLDKLTVALAHRLVREGLAPRIVRESAAGQEVFQLETSKEADVN